VAAAYCLHIQVSTHCPPQNITLYHFPIDFIARRRLNPEYKDDQSRNGLHPLCIISRDYKYELSPSLWPISDRCWAASIDDRAHAVLDLQALPPRKSGISSAPDKKSLLLYDRLTWDSQRRYLYSLVRATDQAGLQTELGLEGLRGRGPEQITMKYSLNPRRSVILRVP
jgi:hypothetical protein